MEDKKLNKIEVQQIVGWSYSEFNWFTEKEARLANKKRDDLLKLIFNKSNHSFFKNKIYIGNLSPGCLICGSGYWSCLFINSLCTASCFYCPQDRKIKKERPPLEGGIIFDKAENYVNYLEKFNFKGVGFSGGETLLVFQKLLTYIKKIKEKFGKKFYVWIYTNGNLATKDRLIRLKKAGLDEIRFNISTRGYNLQPVELARNIFNTVTVEIPCIPEDYEIVKKTLIIMQKIGVKYLNIHQLFATNYNFKNFINRDYTFLHHGHLPIFESEMVALKLMKFALDNKISLSINYCSQAYKNIFQPKGRRERAASLIKKNFEELTNSGYIRSLSIQDSKTNIKKIIKILNENKCKGDLWLLNDTKTEIFIHSSLLQYIDFNKYDLTISYFEPQIRSAYVYNESYKEISLDSQKKVYIAKQNVARLKLQNTILIQTFHKLFIDNINKNEALHYFYRNYNLKRKASLEKMKEEIGFLLSLEKWEQLEAGFPEIY